MAMFPSQATRSGIFSHATRAIIVVSCLISFGRISAIHNYYHAPFNVYHHLQMYELTRLALAHNPQIMPSIDPSLPHKQFTVALDKSQAISLHSLKDQNLRLCLGKEWHRFPSSWLVPDEVETRFVKSEFAGILPKQWEEPGEGKGLFGRATAVRPTGMNMFNREESDRYVSLSHFQSSLSLSRDSQRVLTLLSLCRSTSRHVITLSISNTLLVPLPPFPLSNLATLSILQHGTKSTLTRSSTPRTLQSTRERSTCRFLDGRRRIVGESTSC